MITLFSSVEPWFIIAMAVIFGLCFGSFLNVVIYRLPIMIERAYQTSNDASGKPFDLTRPSSACTHCKAPINAWHNIPVIGFLLIGGKCAGCGKPISLRYPVVEILGAIIAVFAVTQATSNFQLFAILVFSYALLALIFIDIEHYLLPDIITLPLLWLGLLVNLNNEFVNLHDAVIGATVGYLSLWLLFHIFRIVTGKEGLGYGDFKLVAALGAWMGWQSVPLIVLIGSCVGAIVGGIYLMLAKKGKDHPIPFGPFLAMSGWLMMFWEESFMNGFFNFSRLF